MASTTTAPLDKRIVGLRCEVEQLGDKLDALETPRNAAEKEALIAKWHSIRKRSNTISECFEQAKAHEADLAAQYAVAHLTTEFLSNASGNYFNSAEKAHQAIIDHKTKHPALYPAGS
jgi:hypothetical protein